MAKSTCENNIVIGGAEAELNKFVEWINSQTHEQAPDAYWAALYNLEQEANSLVRADRQTWLNRDVYEGSPDHGYGVARFKAHKTSISFNFPSKNDPCLGLILVMARRFPELTFHNVFTDYDTGTSGEAYFVAGKLDSFDVDEDEVSSEMDWGDEDSNW